MIDTDAYSVRLREKAIRADDRQLLVANFRGSSQEADLSEPPNCGGLGRIRHFRRTTSPGWVLNPLPIDPACSFLGLHPGDELQAQVFQNAACNWRCWYCFVPFELLAARQDRASWVTAEELVERYIAEVDRPSMIDLTGGQPDLVPEWVPWMLQALKSAKLADHVYVWSDDNLSNDYFWRYLDQDTRSKIVSWPGYGRVCCFKGFDEASFAFNTMAAPALFDRQFELFERLLVTGLDLYAYVTFTSPTDAGISKAMRLFVDRLQSISEAVPLRVVPLEVTEYGPVTARLNPERRHAFRTQWSAIAAWQAELERRFSPAERSLPIHRVCVHRSVE